MRVGMASRRDPVSVARLVIHRAAGGTEIHYSFEPVPWHQLGRRWRLRKHLRFMREEDRKAGYGR